MVYFGIQPQTSVSPHFIVYPPQCAQPGRGAYFPLFADIHRIHRGIVCWISLAGIEFAWKAWIFHEK